MIWLAPQYFEDNEENAPARAMMEEYVFLAFVHASISQFGEWSFVAPSELVVEIGDSHSMKPLARDSLAPVVRGTVDTMKAVLGQGLGMLGEGMQILVYDGSKVDSCREGVVWVPYQGERYEYRTPIVGCP